MIVVLAAHNEDAPTRCSHWIALQTCERLGAELGLAVTLLDGASAQRKELEQALIGATQGLAFFGHGGPDRLFGTECLVVLDRDNIHIACDRWVHAFACRAGETLAGEAMAAGVSCFVGYDCSLVFEWEPGEIPQPIRAAFTELVTQTTIELARGARDLSSLRRAALLAQAAVVIWCDENPDQANGLEITAQQLLNRLVVRAISPR